MITKGKYAGLMLAVFWAVLPVVAGIGGLKSTEQHSNKQSRVAIAHPLPEMDGSHLKVTLVEVSYAPGGSSAIHTHPCPVIGYVAEGAIRFRVNYEPEIVYKAGETFYEAPHSIHRVSANASATQPAKLLAYFVCDQERPLTAPVQGYAPDQK